MEKKNYMKEVAALLEVELDEHFKMINENGNVMQSEYILYENGAAQYVKYDDYDEENNEVKGAYYKNTGILTYLLTGEWKIKKLPFKPKYSEKYWSLFINSQNEVAPDLLCWWNTSTNYIHYYNGLCFRTEEEAEVNKDKLQKIINYYNSEED